VIDKITDRVKSFTVCIADGTFRIEGYADTYTVSKSASLRFKGNEFTTFAEAMAWLITMSPGPISADLYPDAHQYGIIKRVDFTVEAQSGNS